MAPCPKRKHSTMRKGKRVTTRKIKLANLVDCKQCHKPKLPHRICKRCNK